jgi:hypothetical protein
MKLGPYAKSSEFYSSYFEFPFQSNSRLLPYISHRFFPSESFYLFFQTQSFEAVLGFPTNSLNEP